MITLLYTLIITQITILCVTIYLHRGVTHRGLEFHPVLSHFMRFWLWLTTGMITKQWVAIHRKHHRFIDTDGDPHSPKLFGIKNIVLRGVYYYYKAAKDARMIVEYGVGTPNDWVERKVYTKHNFLGVFLMLAINILLFGWIGILIWLVQIVWIPFWAAGIINGLGHWWGYKNTDNKDSSTNIFPLAIWIGGEELHNNHHAEPANPRLSRKWWEIDIGWVWINIFKHLRLLKIR
jgi:stearoyl-CoA desaturase (delta-9 desaturase)